MMWCSYVHFQESDVIIVTLQHPLHAVLKQAPRPGETTSCVASGSIFCANCFAFVFFAFLHPIFYRRTTLVVVSVPCKAPVAAVARYALPPSSNSDPG